MNAKNYLLVALALVAAAAMARGCVLWPGNAPAEQAPMAATAPASSTEVAINTIPAEPTPVRPPEPSLFELLEAKPWRTPEQLRAAIPSAGCEHALQDMLACDVEPEQHGACLGDIHCKSMRYILAENGTQISAITVVDAATWSELREAVRNQLGEPGDANAGPVVGACNWRMAERYYKGADFVEFSYVDCGELARRAHGDNRQIVVTLRANAVASQPGERR